MVGRPTKYTDELQEKATHYLIAHEDEGDLVPSHVGLADYLDISTVTLYEWAKHDNKPEFTNTLRRVSQKQHRLLINNGLSGDFSAPITKLMMANHGYGEGNHQSDDTPITITIINPYG